jgi:hypothetical protein
VVGEERELEEVLRAVREVVREAHEVIKDARRAKRELEEVIAGLMPKMEEVVREEVFSATAGILQTAEEVGKGMRKVFEERERRFWRQVERSGAIDGVFRRP